MRKLFAVAIAAAISTACVSAQAQDSVESFYKGRQLKLNIASTPGGAFDGYGRLVAQYIGKHIPGNPTVLPVNMPGAGGHRLNTYLYSVAPKDGSELAIIFPGSILDPLIGTQKFEDEPAKFNYLGSANIDTFVCLMRADAPIKTFEDALKTQATLAATADGGSTVDFPALETNLLGAKWRIVRGYPGSREINLAIEQGEVNGTCGMGWSSIQLQNPDWVTNGKFRLLAQETTKGHTVLNGMNVPLTYGFAKTEADRAVLEFAYSQELFGRPFVLPPSVPAERVAALRQAFLETLKDPDLLADAKKQRLEINALSGEEVQQLVAKIYAMPPDIIAKAKDAWVYKGK
jgi:tripartite-type tricarboxylate transporter receptor subunit TctC